MTPNERLVPLRRGVALIGATLLALCIPVAATSADTGADDQPPVPETPTTVYGYDLENDPSQCIGFLPKPNCGREPRDSGDRGGALQYAVFGVLMAGIATISTVIARSVIRRDRAMAVSARPPE